MAFQIKIKAPAWELEKVNGNKTIIFSSRNTGLADFVNVPIPLIVDRLLKTGFLVECDSNGYFVKLLDKIDPALPLHG
jgi:hypothetical protein